jgi:hypothetical protein
MDILQQALDHALEELPRRFLETLLLQKIRAAGITATKTLSHELANRSFDRRSARSRTASAAPTSA